MNELINKLQQLEKETINNLGSSKSINTLRAYKSDFYDFENFALNLDLNLCHQILKQLASI